MVGQAHEKGGRAGKGERTWVGGKRAGRRGQVGVGIGAALSCSPRRVGFGEECAEGKTTTGSVVGRAAEGKEGRLERRV